MRDTSGSIKEIRRTPQATVIVLTGEIDLHHVPAVHPVLLEECARNPATLIIDLGEVGYMDSSGVGVLVHVFQKVKANKGRLRLIRMSPRVRGIFEITRLDRYFVICDSEEEALAK
ncbi:MAG TPA: STAS domain-containing protein [Phycisphaerae bacterium]|nr:STAS domain-containing protein [Phycisphaerae bacterium]